MTAHPTRAQLLDYFLGEGDPEPVEDHLFECAACEAALDDVYRTAAAVVAAMRAGAVGSGATMALVNRMSRDRLNLRHYTIEPGEVVACSVGTGDDFMVGHFVLPPGDFARLDLRVLDADDHELMRSDDIVIDARRHQAILFIPARPVLAEDSALTRYVLVTPAGDEIGRYGMDHTALRDG